MGEPTNADRALWGERAITAGNAYHTENDFETSLADTLADILHACDYRGTNFDRALATARSRYIEEVEEAP
ncbi:MAG: hypothetical protein V3S43_06185 [Acidimicrobiia bacterium]